MAVYDVGSLGMLILQSASKIQEIGGDWYRASEEWESTFPLKVESLKRKIKFWEKQCSKFGISAVSDEHLIQSLIRAKEVLQREEAKLEHEAKKHCGGGCCPKFWMTVFPKKLGLQIQSAIDAFNAVTEMLQYEQDSGSLIHARVMSAPTSLNILSDERYVSFTATERRVCEALTKPLAKDVRGPAVVLLHGGPGKGKSTLARYVAGVHFQKPEHKAAFHHVNILFCGPTVNTSAKESELLHLLGGDPAAIEDLDSLEGGQSGRDWKIRKELLGLLSTRKILLVLDDVWNVEFLQKILKLCGKNVRCLVTSQEETLCHKLNCCSVDEIRIEDVSIEKARNLLASHLRLENHQIPEELIDVADKMIQETDRNPLALASLASAIHVKRSTEREEWEVASENLFTSLKSEDTALILNERYPRSFVATMQLTMENLPPQAQKLLLLTSMFEGHLVPEVILCTLYKSSNIQGDTKTFLDSKNKLQDRQLLTVTSEMSTVLGKPKSSREWQLHSLQKEFLTKEMSYDVNSLFLTLTKQVEQEEEMESDLIVRNSATLVAILCAMYFSRTFASRAALKIGIPFKDFRSRESVCRPLVKLLELHTSEQWTEVSKSFAQEVVLTLTRSGLLRDEAVAHLLLVPTSSRIALRTLCEVSGGPRRIWYMVDVNSMPCTVRVLVSFLGDKVDTYIQRRAILTLHRISKSCSFSSCPAFSDVLEGLVRLLECPSLPRFQRADCVETLASLASRDLLACTKVVEYSGVLGNLVNLLSLDDQPRLQGEAARALGVLARGPGKNPAKVINASGVLPGLVNLLSKNDYVHSSSAPRTNDGPVLSYMGESYAKDNNPHVQLSAADALCSLVWSTGASKLELVKEPGALTGLWKFASVVPDSTDDYLQNLVGEAFSKLAESVETRESVKDLQGLTETLEAHFASFTKFRSSDWVVSILTYIDPGRGNDLDLSSYDELLVLGRIKANLVLARYQEALAELDRTEHEFYFGEHLRKYFRYRCRVEGKLRDFESALADADVTIFEDRVAIRAAIQDLNAHSHSAEPQEILECSPTLLLELLVDLRQRGYLKCIMGDLEGALTHFTETLQISHSNTCYDSWKYEAWKHRGYVRYLMKDMKGARSDGDAALEHEPSRVDELGYGSGSLDECPIEYLGYKLR